MAGVIREVAIMRRLQGHPAVPVLHDVAEAPASYYLVMELCSGGELFDQIIDRCGRVIFGGDMQNAFNRTPLHQHQHTYHQQRTRPSPPD
jgi:serine/threonine protein kinase